MSEISAPSFARVQTRSDPPSAAARSRIDQGAGRRGEEAVGVDAAVAVHEAVPVVADHQSTCDGRAASFTTACVARPWPHGVVERLAHDLR